MKCIIFLSLRLLEEEPYDNYLWSNVDDIDKYIEGLIIKAKESIENVKSSVMTIGKGNEIEINTNKFNV